MNQIADLRRAVAAEMARLQPPPGLESRVLSRAFPSPRPVGTGARSVAFGLSARALKLAGGLLVVVLLVSAVVLGRLVRESGTSDQMRALTPAEQAQLATLEARPLRIPALPVDGSCPSGPKSDISPYLDNVPFQAHASGPVYGGGGLKTDTAQASYWDATYYTDPTVKGPVVIRGRQLDGRLDLVFVGPYAAGAVVRTDVIGGKRVGLYGEAVLPASHPPPSSVAAPGWGIWKVRQGLGKGSIGCIAIQIDSLAASEVVVIAHVPT